MENCTNAFAHFQGFPLLNLLSRNRSESLWEVLGRMMDGTGTEELTQISTHPSPVQESTTTLLWKPGFISCFQSLQCLVILLLALLIWTGSQRFFFAPGGLWGEAGADPGQEQLCRWPWGSPAPLLEQQQQQQSPRCVSCMHSSCTWSHSQIIDRNTSSYITMLMCPCAGENASSTLGSQGSQTASSSGENLCWGEADQAKNTSSLWHCLSWWDCLGENKDGTQRSEWNKWV